MRGHVAEPLAKETRHAHHGAARADTRDERRWLQPERVQLPRDLGTGRFVVRLHVRGIVELLRPEHAARLAREVVGHAYRAQESAELGGYRDHGRTETL